MGSTSGLHLAHRGHTNHIRTEVLLTSAKAVTDVLEGRTAYLWWVFRSYEKLLYLIFPMGATEVFHSHVFKPMRTRYLIE